MSGFLQDTSVFIGLEQGRSVAEAPNGDGRVSVATLTELDVGVRRSSDGAVRERRALTLAKARRFVPLAYDEAVSGELAVLLAAARDQGHRAGLMDTARGSWTPSSPRPRSCTTSQSGRRTMTSRCCRSSRRSCASIAADSRQACGERASGTPESTMSHDLRIRLVAPG